MFSIRLEEVYLLEPLQGSGGNIVLFGSLGDVLNE